MSETTQTVAQPGVTRWGWRAYALAAVVLILDQLTKYWILSVVRLPEGGTMEVFWPLQFTRIWNEGVSFGLLQAGHDLIRWGMVAFNLGNAVDRARFGAVVDFIDVQRLGFFPWIFNIADAGITIGVIAILLDSLRRERPA